MQAQWSLNVTLRAQELEAARNGESVAAMPIRAPRSTFELQALQMARQRLAQGTHATQNVRDKSTATRAEGVTNNKPKDRTATPATSNKVTSKRPTTSTNGQKPMPPPKPGFFSEPTEGSNPVFDRPSQMLNAAEKKKRNARLESPIRQSRLRTQP
jgi:hypothetical protein